MSTRDSYEEAARTVKVNQIVDWVRSQRDDLPDDFMDVIQDAGDGFWTILAKGAGTTFPSVETRQQVIARLKVIDRPTPSDPFDGLDGR